ncbi:chaperonin 10-like protein [Lophiotrema nucula]|uniref:Chaperonin 10-like protein n=1 Tax=Lophiotrema nucula TaxID=690887 RepID=A0A6A5ZR01_9PLEO|nr:chaperonin 10-like protein [Lophiotrema nucula]
MPSADPFRSLPKQQTAVTAQDQGRLAVIHDAPLPHLLPDMAIVRTAAVAINPVDAKMLDYSKPTGSTAGFDFSGTVVALGEKAATAGRLQVGDRVAGMVHGLNKLKPDIGAFAEYVGASADLLLKVPDRMSFEEAATLGMGVTTSVLALFVELKVPATLEELGAAKGRGDVGNGAFVLVAGGSTATGTRAIQLLKLAGLRPITTCSPSNFNLVQRFGAERAFDYHSPTVAADIRAYTHNELAYVLDCVSLAETTQICYDAIGRAGGRYCSLEPFREAVTQRRALTIEPSWILALTIFGEKVAMDGEYGRDALQEHRGIGVRAYEAVQALLDRGLIDTHPAKIVAGGWDEVIKGVDVVRQQNISGYKLVYSVV